MAYGSILHNYELSIYDHTWSAAHCLPNSMHPIDVLTGTAAIWKIKDKWHWISNTEWQCFLMEGTRRYLQNTVSSSTFTATALHIYICVGRCTLNDEIEAPFKSSRSYWAFFVRSMKCAKFDAHEKHGGSPIHTSWTDCRAISLIKVWWKSHTT